jgi:outer membrane lipoprotein carrier protein
VLAVGCGTSGPPTGASAGTAAENPAASPSAPSVTTTTVSQPVEQAAPASSPIATASPLPGRTTPSAATATPGKPPRAPAVDAGPADGGAPDASSSEEGAPDAGAVSPAQQLAQQVDAIFAGKKTYSAHFEQQHTLRINNKVEDSSGTVLMERPGKISFRYDPPNMNRIVSDGVTMKVYIAADKTMYEKPMGSTQYPGVLAFMMGEGIARSFSFTIKSVASYPAGTVLEGKPLVPDPSYETVVFFVESALLAKGDPGAMERVLIQDAQGNKNRFTFTGATQPTAVAPAEFTFTPPPGTTIQR